MSQSEKPMNVLRGLYSTTETNNEARHSCIAIRVLIKSCNFCCNCRNSTLRDRIVLCVQNHDIQEALLKEHNISLELTIDTCRAAENASLHSKAICPETVSQQIKICPQTKTRKSEKPCTGLHERTQKQT